MSQPATMTELGFVDIVDFVERTTYDIWNERQPDLVRSYYPLDSVIWGDGGDLVGREAVVGSTRRQQAGLPDYRGVIQDTIWTGGDAAGYRTSMRWIARGTRSRTGTLGSRDGKPLLSSCIANCVVLGGQYVEEWGAGDGQSFHEELDADLDAAATEIARSDAPAGEAGRRRTRELGTQVPAIPQPLAGSGLYVQELLHDLYNQRDLDVVEKRYAPGAPYTFSVSRWNAGHDGVRREVSRWLDLLPDLQLDVEELYWQDDAPRRSRVAVRYRLTGTAQRGGRDRPVTVTGIHHVHVRGDLVVAEWAEYDSLALHAQLM